MVAITVILAAVIAAFVFGLAGTTSTSKNVGLTVSTNSTWLTITVNGGADLPSLNDIEMSVDGTSYGPIKTGGTGYTGTTFTVGQIIKNQSPVTNFDGKRVILVGKFKDGSSQILWDRVL